MDTHGRSALHGQLVEMRQRQRRHLAAVPSELFDGIRWQDPPPDTPGNASSQDVEFYLRDSADAMLDDAAKDYLDQRHAGHVAAYVTRLLSALEGTYLDRYMDWVLNERDGRRAPGVIRDVRDPVNEAICKFVILTLAADHVADDGYVDPRLEAPR